MQQFAKRDLETLCRDSKAYVHQLKERIQTLVREKLNDFEDEFVKELQKELTYFTVIVETQDIEESLDKLKRQIKIKLSKMKDMHDYLEMFQLSSKLVAVDPLLVLPQYQTDLDLDMLKGNVDCVDLQSESDGRRKRKRRKVRKFFIDYLCPVCNKQLKTSYAARMHLRIIHGIEQHLFCPHSNCKFVAGQAGDLAKHLIENHGSPINKRNLYHYQCEYSGQYFKTKIDLQNHITQEKGYLNPPINSTKIQGEDLVEEGFV